MSDNYSRFKMPEKKRPSKRSASGSSPSQWTPANTLSVFALVATMATLIYTMHKDAVSRELEFRKPVFQKQFDAFIEASSLINKIASLEVSTQDEQIRKNAFFAFRSLCLDKINLLRSANVAEACMEFLGLAARVVFSTTVSYTGSLEELADKGDQLCDMLRATLGESWGIADLQKEVPRIQQRTVFATISPKSPVSNEALAEAFLK